MICETCKGFGVRPGATVNAALVCCVDCRGSGYVANEVKTEPAASPCPLCRGSGKLYRSAHAGGKPAKNTAGETIKPPALEETECPRCAGSGDYVPVKPDGTPLLVEAKTQAEMMRGLVDAPFVVGPAEVPAKPRAVEAPKPNASGDLSFHVKASRYDVLDKKTRRVLRSAPFKGFKLKADGSGVYEPVEQPAYNPDTEDIALVYS